MQVLNYRQSSLRYKYISMEGLSKVLCPSLLQLNIDIRNIHTLCANIASINSPGITSIEPIFLAVGDFNNDKRLDIIIANFGTDNIGMFFGYANEGFLNAPAYSTGSSSQVTSIAVGDFNNDTRLDVVITNNATNNVKIIFGSGYGTFLYDITYSTGNASQPCSVSVADLNNDNQLDFVVANSGINTISIFLSNGSGTFSNQITYSTGVHSHQYSVSSL
ncbi:unnamed protein product, partial [Adineta steineri]